MWRCAVVQPSVAEAKSDFEIFAALARAMGQELAYTEGRDVGQWLRGMYDAFRASAPDLATLPDFEGFWQTGRLDLPLPRRPRVLLQAFRNDPVAAPLPTPSGKIELHSAALPGWAWPIAPVRPVGWRLPNGWARPPRRPCPFTCSARNPATGFTASWITEPRSRAEKITGSGAPVDEC